MQDLRGVTGRVEGAKRRIAAEMRVMKMRGGRKE